MEINNLKKEVENLKKHKTDVDELHNIIKILVNDLDEKSEDLVVSITITMNATISSVLS